MLKTGLLTGPLAWCILNRILGVVESWWAPRSSKPVAGRVAGRSGFDSHPLPPGSVSEIILLRVQEQVGEKLAQDLY
jgi:hypothetical protein